MFLSNTTYFIWW